MHLGAGLAIALVVLAGAALVALRAAGSREDQRHHPGILAGGPIGELPIGGEVCQRPLDISQSVDHVGIALGTGGDPGPRIDVEVRELPSGRVISRGTLPGGYLVNAPGNLGLDLRPRVPEDSTVEVCGINRGRRSVTVVGHQSIYESAAHLDGKNLNGYDWGVYFPALEKRSDLELLPEIFDRAAVLRPDFIGAWTYWLGLVALFVGGPLLLARALRAASADEHPDAPR